MTTPLTDRGVGQLEHLVQLYDDDALLIMSLQQFLANGLSAGEACVVIATPEHRAAVDAALIEAGFDVAALSAAGRYLALDAQQVLNAFLLDGACNPDLFLSTLGRVIERAAGAGRGVRAFGEMVSLLWESGQVPAALELEALWNALAETHEFSLLCSYPVASFDDRAFAEPFRQMCAKHSRVLPATRSAAVVSLPAALSSGREARTHLRATLPPMGALHVLDDAVLLLTEIVNNAIVHANSAVEVRVTRTGDCLRVEATDNGPGGALRRNAESHDMGGRGLALLDSLATRWGAVTDAAPRHRVWFELDLTPQA